MRRRYETKEGGCRRALPLPVCPGSAGVLPPHVAKQDRRIFSLHVYGLSIFPLIGR